MTNRPYKVTPVFDEASLPLGLRRVHSTKEGVWGLVRILEGRLRLFFPETGRELALAPGQPGLVAPCEPHLVEPVSPFRMQVEFYRARPSTQAVPGDRGAPSAPAA